MRKYVLGCIFLLMLLYSCPTYVSAANWLASDEINVILERDGDVRVSETWSGDFSDPSATENYIVKLRNTEVEDFEVSMDGKAFAFLPSWDIEASFSEKAYKYGIHYGDDLELCWGISDHGPHTYQVAYTMKGLAHKFRDKNGDYSCDGFNIRFFNDKMSTGPTEVTVTIALEEGELTEETATVWSFGFEGEQEISDGVIKVRSLEDLGEKNYVTVLAALEENTLTNAAFSERTWEETHDTALKGSDYAKDGFSLKKYASVFLMIFFGGAMVFLNIRRAARKKSYLSQVEYVRDVPLPYSLGDSVVLSQAISRGNSSGNFAMAGILELVYTGCLALEETGMGGKNAVQLRLMGPPSEDPTLLRLYHLLEAADKSGDGILDGREMRKRAFGESIYQLCQEMDREIQTARQIRGGMQPWRQEGQARIDVDAHAGLMQFLRDMTLVGERSVKELAVWHWYLVYAAVFGISGQVSQEFSALSHISPEHEREVDRLGMYSAYYRDTIGHSVSSAVSAHSSSSSSSGGGGGSSGGGSGGGSR